MSRGKRIRLMAMVLAGAAACAGFRAELHAQSTQSAAVNDLDQLSATLNDPQSPLEARSEAARRLVSRQSPVAKAALRAALVSVNPNGQLAAARALLDDPAPDASLVDPLFAALDSSASRTLTEAVARALASHRSNPEVLTRLISKLQTLPESSRREVVRALGSIPEKRSAEVLVGLLRSPGESAGIHNAAAEALVDLTGITDFGQDTDKWTAWWLANSNKPDAQFHHDLVPKLSAQYAQLRQHYEQLNREFQATLDEKYQSTAADKRQDVLMQYFHSDVAEKRVAGAVIIRQEALAAKTVPPVAKEQLRTMIGDSNPDVRIAVARALATINDAESLDPLLAQLSQETDGMVRAALAEALAPIDDVKAVPALLRLLNDPSHAAARAGADAIARRGPKIREDPALALQTAEELRRTFASHPASPGSGDLRASLIRAMASLKLKHRPVLDLLTGVLEAGKNETPEMRAAAISAIGEIGDPQYADVVAAALQDQQRIVRLAAVRALSMLPNAADYADLLRRRLDPKEEPDEPIRAEIWNSLNSVFPSMAPERLKSFAESFNDQPERRLKVLQALADVLRAKGLLDDMALEQQNIGETLMKFDRVEQYREAANYFKVAFDHLKAKGNETVVTNIGESCMKALLRGKQYGEAISFAAQSITENRDLELPLSGAIRIEAERLQLRGDLEDVLKLITEAKAMQPPLKDMYREQLTNIEAKVREKLPTQPSPPGAGPVQKPANASIADPK